MGETDIEWASKVWNVTRGCRRVSPGCGGAAGEGGCYAERQAYRFSGPGQPYEGLVRLSKHGPQWTGKGRFVADKLVEPLRWRAPKDGSRLRIFVNSMSDLFFEEFTNEEIAAAFGVMAACPQHDFLILTKRAARMREWFAWISDDAYPGASCLGAAARALADFRYLGTHGWPLPNVWLGVSVENQETADERISLLLETPAAVRWVSAEPLLAEVGLFAFLKTPLRDQCLANLRSPEMPGIDWVVCGGESGPGARPFHLAWGRSIVEQCKAANVACFFKQMGSRPVTECEGVSYPVPLQFKDRKGGDIAEFPDVLQVREFPR